MFVSHVDTGVYGDLWGGVVMGITSPAIQDTVPESWAAQLVGLLVDLAPLLGALYGVVRYQPVKRQRDPLGYSLHNYGPVRDPDDLPGSQWISLLPPRVVDRLGGIDRVATEAAVHRLETVAYVDGRVGCVVQVTADAAEFVNDRAADWRAFLEPVLCR
jgi:hypothetical protein